MREYCITDNQKELSDRFGMFADIKPQIIQHILQNSYVVGNYIYYNHDVDTVVSTTTDRITEYFRRYALSYVFIHATDDDHADIIIKDCHQFVIVSYAEIFEHHQSLLLRRKINRIFNATADLELIIDVGDNNSFPMNTHDTTWFPKSIFQGSIIGHCLTTVGNNVFKNSKLEYLMLPDSVTTIGDGFLYECTGLTSVTIPDSVTSIGNKFLSWCINLTSVTIPDSVTTIGDNFLSECTRLTSVTIPDSVTSISDGFLSWCINLTSVIIPDSVTIIGNCFLNECTSLTSVIIPNSVTSIGPGLLNQCVNLRSVTIPQSVTIPEWSLSGCTGVSLLRSTGITNNINDSNSRSNIVSHVISNIEF
jgi:hypothetical protein